MQKNNQHILPPQTIGIIGGGQLGRMMAIEARYMGYQIAVLDPTPNCPTAQVADKQITASYDDLDAIKELIDVSDVITYEFENVDLEAAALIEEFGLLPQGARALEVTQNREKEKSLVKELNLPVPEFHIVRNEAECEEALQNIEFPAVIKTCRGGYDGKGQIKLESQDDSDKAIDFVKEHEHCIVEKWLSFDKEISVVFTRSLSGQMTYFPIPENEHKDHILYQSAVPARISETVTEKALEAARMVAEEMNIVGTFAIELFVSGDEIYINEMAPRPHNSGHYTIEACNVSQFGQHIRAICGLPLKQVTWMQPATMVNVLGEDVEQTLKTMQETEDGFVHLYGKDAIKPKRKMGHITFAAGTVDEVHEQVKQFQKTYNK